MDTNVIIPRERIHSNPQNPLPPLPDDEFAELRESIREHGILESLIVVKDERNPGHYIAIAGNHRLKVAEELGIPEVRCTVIENSNQDVAYETELYRRMLTKQDKEYYAQTIHKKTQQKREEEIERSLIDELYEMYRRGEMNRVQINSFIKMSKAEQRSFHEIFLTRLAAVTSPTEQDIQAQQKKEESKQAHQEELEQARQKQQELESKLKTMEAEKQAAEKARKELEKQNQKASELLREKMEELEEVREQTTVQAAATIREKVTEQIIEIQTQVSQSAKAIKEKDKELEQLREERDKAIRDLDDNDVKLKAVWLSARQYYDSVKDAMNVIFKPDMLRKRIAIVKNELEMLETVWTSYTIDANLRNEVLTSLGDIQKKVNSMVKTLPQIDGPQLPVITKQMFEDSMRLLPPKENEARLLQ